MWPGTWVTSRTRSVGWDLKSHLVESCRPKKKGDFRLFTEALWWVPHVCVWWDRWKSQNRKIVPLSPYVEKPFYSKVMKGFVPELRSRKCFSCFGIPMFYVYMLWTFYVRFTYPYHEYVTWGRERTLWSKASGIENMIYDRSFWYNSLIWYCWTKIETLIHGRLLICFTLIQSWRIYIDNQIGNWPTRLKLSNKPTTSLLRVKTLPTSVLDMTLKI